MKPKLLSATVAVVVWTLAGGTSSEQSNSGRIRWYFGVSPSSYARLAWVIGLDQDRHRGQLLTPTGFLALTSSLEGEGRLRFRSEPVLEAEYRFVGSVSEENVAGDLHFVTLGSQLVKAGWSVAGQRVTVPQSQDTRLQPVRFSSIRYSAESGDLLGADIEFVSIGSKVAGVMILNGRNWGEVNVPLAVDNITEVNSVIKFEAQLDDGPVRYELRRETRDSVVLHRVGGKAAFDEKMKVVPSRITPMP